VAFLTMVQSFSSSLKSNGNYDDGMFNKTCHLIQKSFVSSEVEQFIQSSGWKHIVYWDEILHKAASISLDMTIERLGREAFQRQLDVFRRVQVELTKQCSSKVVFPCSSTGKRIPPDETDCLFGDNACGFDCMDKFFEKSSVAASLEQ